MYSIKVLMTSTNAVPSINWGSLMHGMLIEHLHGAWPSLLHEGDRRSLTQWVEPVNRQTMIWHVNILDDHLAVSFLESCREGDKWLCQHNGSTLIVNDLQAAQYSLFEYSRTYMSVQKPERFVRINFITPTTHKSQGKYVLFPSTALIINSIRKRIGNIDEAVEPNEVLLSKLIENTEIRNYQLKTQAFGMEGQWVRGYTGNLILSMKGDQDLLRFGQMYFGLGEWFGIGIKTTLGMGGCTVSPAEKDEVP